MQIDAHQHFWHFNPERDSWITEEMAVIQNDFLPQDLQPLLLEAGLDGCVAVQASQSEDETDFLISLATEKDFIKGVVGWVDLQASTLDERLQHYKTFPVVKGFRHVLQGEAQRDLMLTPAFINGIAALQPYGFTYDLLIFPDQLNFCKKLVAQFPDQAFVLDHLGKPFIKRGEIKEWQQDLQQLAKQPNVYCKLSGMVTEADWQGWTRSNFTPYLDAAVEAFGVDRLLFGSDWPVCNLAASYKQVVEIVRDYFRPFSQQEQQKIFGGNAVRFYNL